MSDRVTSKTAIHVKLETTYGQWPEGATWLNSERVLLTEPPRHQIRRELVDRTLVRPYQGASEQLPGPRVAEIEFAVELVGSVTGGAVPPAWANLLRACGMAQTVFDSGNPRVEYTPVSDNPESCVIRYWVDGVLYQSRGARGTVTFDLTAYQRPVMRFKFVGFDTFAQTGSSNVADFNDFAVPEVIMDANNSDIRLGCTLSAGVLSGGTELASLGMTIDLGQKIDHIPMLGGERVSQVGRETTGRMRVALTPAQEVTWRTEINANDTTSLGFQIGNSVGKFVRFFAPRVQRVNPQMEDYKGFHMVNTELRCLPSVGNDEIRIVVR